MSANFLAEAPVDRTLELCGQVCPTPTVEMRRALKQMSPGQVLEIRTDYLPTRQTIPDQAQDLGYPCLVLDGDQAIWRIRIQKV